jgi:hypothetical protein
MNSKVGDGAPKILFSTHIPILWQFWRRTQVPVHACIDHYWFQGRKAKDDPGGKPARQQSHDHLGWIE